MTPEAATLCARARADIAATAERRAWCERIVRELSPLVSHVSFSVLGDLAGSGRIFWIHVRTKVGSVELYDGPPPATEDAFRAKVAEVARGLTVGLDDDEWAWARDVREAIKRLAPGRHGVPSFKVARLEGVSIKAESAPKRPTREEARAAAASAKSKRRRGRGRER